MHNNNYVDMVHEASMYLGIWDISLQQMAKGLLLSLPFKLYSRCIPAVIDTFAATPYMVSVGRAMTPPLSRTSQATATASEILCSF